MNIFRRPLLLIVAAMFAPALSNAQEGTPIYSDYLTDNQYLIHPSMAGIGDCAKVRLTARQQWGNVQDAPALQTLTFNTRVGQRSGVGAILVNDKNGYTSQQGATLTYAHHIDFSRTDYDLNRLSFGVSAGVWQTTIDETTFYNGGGFDPNIGGIVQKDANFNFDLGASYNYYDLFAHFTVKNVFTTKNDLYTDYESDNRRRYVLSAGYVFGNTTNLFGYGGDGIKWEPSVMAMFVEETKEKILDTNIKMYKDFENGSFFAGISYRTMFEGAEYQANTNGKVRKQYYNSVSPLVGVRYKNLMVGYTFTHQFGEVLAHKGGFHQLSLGFNFMCKSKGNGNYYYPNVNF